MNGNEKTTLYIVFGFFYQILAYGIMEYANNFVMFMAHIIFWPLFIIMNNFVVLFVICFILFNLHLVIKYIDFNEWKKTINDVVFAIKLLFIKIDMKG